MLLKLCFLLAVSFSFVVAARAADEEVQHTEGLEIVAQPVEDRTMPVTLSQLKAFQITATRVRILTETAVSFTQSLCADLVNVTGACRRRRRGMERPVVLSFDDDEEINIYNPSPVQKIEPTPEPSLPFRPEHLVESSGDPVSLDIIGLNDNCLNAAPRFGFGNLFSGLNITLKYTTTLTATVTVTKISTSGTKSFFVSGCTPSPFLYKTCLPATRLID